MAVDNSSDVSDIYVIGDIIARSKDRAIDLDVQVPTAASSFAVDAAREPGHGETSNTFISWLPRMGGSGPTVKEF